MRMSIHSFLQKTRDFLQLNQAPLDHALRGSLAGSQLDQRAFDGGEEFLGASAADAFVAAAGARCLGRWRRQHTCGGQKSHVNWEPSWPI